MSAKPKAPKWIWICGQVVDLKFVKNPVDDAGEPKLGSYTASKNRIEVKRDMDPEVQRVTVVHELLHVLWYLTGASTVLEGIRCGAYKKADHASAQEVLTVVLEPGLWMLLTGNPDLVAWLNPPPE